MAACFQKMLTDYTEGLYVESWQISSENFTGISDQWWSITKYALKGGKQHGVDIVEIDNGATTIVVIPSRGMNILEAYTDEVSLAWDSPVEEVVYPALVNELTHGGLGWLAGFTEMVSRCGLESHGAPGPDTMINNNGQEVTVELPLHGFISNIPASKLWVTIELRRKPTLSVTGEVYETSMFGACFKLTSTLSTELGASSFTIKDAVENLKGVPAEMELLYHCNFGPPVLEEGSRLLAPIKKVSARDEIGLAAIDTWDVYGPPQEGFIEQCYFFKLHADKNRRTKVGLVNAAENLGVGLAFSLDELPAFTLWKNTASERDGYVTGLEPGSDYPNNRLFEREKGRLVTLDAGQVYNASIEFSLLQNESDVSALKKDIGALRRGRKKEICSGLDAEFAPEA